MQHKHIHKYNCVHLVMRPLGSVAANKLHMWVKLLCFSMSDPVDKIMLRHTITGMCQNNII